MYNRQLLPRFAFTLCLQNKSRDKLICDVWDLSVESIYRTLKTFSDLQIRNIFRNIDIFQPNPTLNQNRYVT